MTPEEIAQAIMDDRMIIPDGVDRAALAHEISALIASYGETCAARERESIVNGLHNAALLVRRDGGSEERAKAFEDAAFIAGAHARQ